MSIWFPFVVQPLTNLIVFFYEALGHNLGLAIIISTLAIRGALIPLTAPGMQSAQKLQELKPQLDKLKDKHKDDKQALAQAQLDLYKANGVNPAGSLLPTIIQFVVLIGLFQSFTRIIGSTVTVETINQNLYPFLKLPVDHILNTQFFFWNLSHPDTISLTNPINLGFYTITVIPGILLFSSAIIQFISSKFMMPKPKAQPKNKKSDEPDMGSMMQKQMRVMMPIMTLLIGFRFPAGLVLYWMTFSFLMIVQQKFLKKAPAKAKKNN